MKLLFYRYGIWGCLKLFNSILLTKLFYKRARLIRFPIDIRGGNHIDWGNALTTGKYCRFETLVNENSLRDKYLKFGSNVILNDFVHIAAKDSVVIGDNVLIGSNVFISDHNHGNYGINGDSPLSNPNERSLIVKPVKIEENVWIGEFVSILPGVTIGKGSVIGTMSVVNKSIPPYSIAVGAPAKVIKTFNFDTMQWERING